MDADLLKYALTVIAGVFTGGFFTYLASRSSDKAKVKIAELESQKVIAERTQEEIEKLRGDVLRLTTTVAELTVKLNTALSRMEENNVSTRGIL